MYSSPVSATKLSASNPPLMALLSTHTSAYPNSITLSLTQNKISHPLTITFLSSIYGCKRIGDCLNSIIHYCFIFVIGFLWMTTNSMMGLTFIFTQFVLSSLLLYSQCYNCSYHPFIVSINSHSYMNTSITRMPS